MSTVTHLGFSLKSKTELQMAYVDPDETAGYELSYIYLQLHYLHSYLFWSAGMKKG